MHSLLFKQSYETLFFAEKKKVDNNNVINWKRSVYLKVFVFAIPQTFAAVFFFFYQESSAWNFEIDFDENKESFLQNVTEMQNSLNFVVVCT